MSVYVLVVPDDVQVFNSLSAARGRGEVLANERHGSRDIGAWVRETEDRYALPIYHPGKIHQNYNLAHVYIVRKLEIQ